MELLLYTTPELAKAVKEQDPSNEMFDVFNSYLDSYGGKLLHASNEYNTLVIDVADENVGLFKLLLSEMWSGFVTQVEDLQYQVRVNLSAEFAEAARNNPANPAFKPVADILKKYNATIKSQFDAFADYCREQEEAGNTGDTLYKWTKATIEKPGKKEQYATRFTVYADGGKEVYSKATAEGLMEDFKPMLDSGAVTRLNKFNTDPAQNPQAGPQFK